MCQSTVVPHTNFSFILLSLSHTIKLIGNAVEEVVAGIIYLEIGGYDVQNESNTISLLCMSKRKILKTLIVRSERVA